MQDVLESLSHTNFQNSGLRHADRMLSQRTTDKKRFFPHEYFNTLSRA